MNSEIKINNFTNNKDLLYGAHYITLASDVSFENNVGKFIMGYVTPNLTGKAFDKILPKNNTHNLINKDFKVNRITASNYIELEVPKHLFYILNIEEKNNNGEISIIINRKEYKAGQKFLVVNADGDVDCPHIVGVV